MNLTEEELIYDWNTASSNRPARSAPRLVDHTLSSARLTSWLELPDLEGQRALLGQLSRLGLDQICLGSWADKHVRALVDETSRLEIQGWAEAPPGPLPKAPLGAYLSHRHKTWPERSRQASGRVVLVIQDISRLRPQEITHQLKALVGTPVSAVCLSDDGGRATPAGASDIVVFVKRALDRLGLELDVEWSGRNDRGLALANALSAWEAGAQTLHCSFFSLGEGCGLVAAEQLVVNLSLLGALKRDFRELGTRTQTMAQILGLNLYPNLPVIGVDAFRTGTGVHAAAILKAHRKGHDWLADLIYSGVPATQFGFRQIIEVGPMAGASNVQHWLEHKGVEPSPELVQAILALAKNSQKVLEDEELWSVVQATRP